jgi:hypothetical protein
MANKDVISACNQSGELLLEFALRWDSRTVEPRLVMFEGIGGIWHQHVQMDVEQQPR